MTSDLLPLQQKQKIMEKAKKTHKQRVEVSVCVCPQLPHCPSSPQEMNQYLDTLTEHFDIPKVSWTK